MGRLDGKVAIITGGGGGIGRGTALVLAREGAAIVIAERNTQTGAESADLVKAAGGRALAVTCDVRKQAEVDAVAAAAFETFGGIDILVNTAQDAPRWPMVGLQPLTETSVEDMNLAWESGPIGTFHFMLACFPRMKDRGGKIINFGSAAGIQGAAGYGAYAAAKEAIRALTRVAANEWAKHKINVNAICPIANSPGWKEWERLYPEAIQSVLAMIPLGRVGDTEKDIGRIVLFLASSDSDYLTGQTIFADGGTTMR